MMYRATLLNGEKNWSVRVGRGEQQGTFLSFLDRGTTEEEEEEERKEETYVIKYWDGKTVVLENIEDITHSYRESKDNYSPFFFFEHICYYMGACGGAVG